MEESNSKNLYFQIFTLLSNLSTNFLKLAFLYHKYYFLEYKEKFIIAVKVVAILFFFKYLERDLRNFVKKTFVKNKFLECQCIDKAP